MVWTFGRKRPRPESYTNVEDSDYQPAHSNASTHSNADTDSRAADNGIPKRQSTGSKTDGRARGLRRLHPWWPEITAALLSIAFLITTAAVLFSFHGKPIISWNLPWHITPNTVASLLMISCRVTMMIAVASALGQLKWVYFEQQSHPLLDFYVFDEATRGPWGAVHMLWRIKWRAFVAFIGALITILSLAMDPFTQQVISYVDVTKDDTEGTALLWQSRAWDISTSEDLGREQVLPTRYDTVSISSAIQDGILKTSHSELFSCSSGSCTWDAFTSLGICSSCVNVSGHLMKTCRYQSDVVAEWYWACNYTTPQNITFSVTGFRHTDTMTYMKYATIWKSSTKPDDVDSLLPKLGTTAALRLPQEYITDCSAWGCTIPEPLVYECDLRFCLKSWPKRSSINGTLDQLAPVEQPLIVPYDYSREESICTSRDDCTAAFSHCFNDVWASGPDRDSLFRRIAGYSQADYPPEVECPTWPNQKNSSRVYWINDQDRRMLKGELATFLSQKLETSDEGDQGFGALLYNGHNGNFSETMTSISIAMTNAIRQGPNRTSVPGQAQFVQTVIRVNWPWLALPAALVLISAGFVCVAIVFSAEKSDIVWKSSSLAVLFHGLDTSEWNQVHLQERSLDEMEKLAKSMYVRLSDTTVTGLKLKKD